MTIHQTSHAVVRWVAFLWVAGFLTLGAYDLWLIYKGKLGGGNSASSVILEVASVHPIWVAVFSLAVGILAGHFFWPQMRS